MNESHSVSDMRVEPIKVAFFGTPEYAVPSLRFLHAGARFDISLVVTQPDRPAGRRHRLTASPVKIAAEELGLHLYQPASLKSAESREPLIASGADVFVVVAYGLIFGARTLSIPGSGCVNLHASLLPKFRGASPIAAAILAGESITGVTMMLMDVGIDTGAILDTAKTEIEATDTTASLSQRLGLLGAELLPSGLAGFFDGTVQPVPQPKSGASLTRMMTKDDGWIDWSGSAGLIERQVRAMWEWPRAWTTLEGTTLQIHATHVAEGHAAGHPGQVLQSPDQPEVACGTGSLALDVVQPAGGKPISGAAWLAGMRGMLPRLGDSNQYRAAPPLTVKL